MDQGFYTKINWWNAAFISKKIRCRSRTRLLQNFPKRSCTVQIAILTPLRKEAKKNVTMLSHAMVLFRIS